jgi:cholesterol oxidase
VWLFDRRSSPRLPAARTDYSVDDVVKYDWPAAVAEVKRLTGAPDVQVVAHCMGSMTLLLALMTGMQGVRSAVCSQVTTYFKTELKNRIKAGLALADLLQLVGIGSVTTHVEPKWQDAAIEAALRLYPVPSSERCDSPVCHRIWGIFGPVYKHDNLNRATHLAMNEIFGISSTTVFKHLLKILGQGRAVDQHGNDVYSDKKHLLTLPIHFLAGKENQMAFPESSELLYEELRQLHGPGNYSRSVFDGYAHLDCFIGKNSAIDIFPDVLKQLERFN